MKKEIQRLLSMGGISRRYRCHDYFTKCVLQALKNPLSLQNIRRDIYLPVAQECHKEIYAIEHGIRHVRDLFVSNGATQILAEMNGGNFCENKIPHPSDVIEIFVFYLRQREEENNEKEEIG